MLKGIPRTLIANLFCRVNDPHCMYTHAGIVSQAFVHSSEAILRREDFNAKQRRMRDDLLVGRGPADDHHVGHAEALGGNQKPQFWKNPDLGARAEPTEEA